MHLDSYCFMAVMHMCFVLICELAPFFCIVSCPINGSNLIVVPLGAAAAEHEHLIILQEQSLVNSIGKQTFVIMMAFMARFLGKQGAKAL